LTAAFPPALKRLKLGFHLGSRDPVIIVFPGHAKRPLLGLYNISMAYSVDDKITSLPDTLCDFAYTCTNNIAIATPTWRFRKCVYCNIFGVASHFTFYSVVTN